MAKLISQNKLHFHQVWETPFTQGLLKEYTGDYGLGKGATEIIEGNFDPNKIPPLSVSTELSAEGFKAAVKKQSEMTSLSLSGCHYGHYKAILIDDSTCFVHATMMTLPFRFGFTPILWAKAIDVMLKKDIGNPKITCLCVIVIVEGGQHNFLSPVQFGNRKGKTSLDALLLKI
eukprot:13121885-Ditylum_brightwellii.AAC.1